MSFWHSKWTAVVGAAALAASVGGFGLVQAASDSENVLTSIDPCRLADSRTASNVGPLAAPLGPGQTATFTAIGDNGNCVGIPADVEVVEVQLTSVGATVDTFWTAYPSDLAERPDVSQLNPRVALATTSNSTMVTLSAIGDFSLYNAAGSSDVVIDVLGYFSPGAGGPEGPAGPQGPVGPEGPQGVQGDQGDQGIQGDPGLAGVEIVNGMPSADDGSSKTVSATCPVGKVALGGGFNVSGTGSPLILSSTATTATEWTVESTGSIIFTSFILTAQVICANAAP